MYRYETIDGYGHNRARQRRLLHAARRIGIQAPSAKIRTWLAMLAARIGGLASVPASERAEWQQTVGYRLECPKFFAEET
jgi:hypothetical protein